MNPLPELKITKTDLIVLLNSLGTTLPTTTKLTSEELETRLTESLDRCQNLSILGKLFKEGIFEISGLPEYTVPADSSMFEEVQRNTLNDLEIDFYSSDTPKPSEAFYRLRRSLALIGKYWDEGKMRCVFQDMEQTSIICMHMVSVHKAGSKTPLFLVFYYHCHIMDPTLTSWFQQSTSHIGLPLVQSSLHEQRLLLRLLRHNALRLPASLTPTRHPHEDQFHLSFLLPLESLTLKSRSLMSVDACAICSKPATSSCGACHAIRYCDTEHQKKDWRKHKPVCQALAKAHWITVPFTGSPFGLSSGVTSVINRHDTLGDPSGPTRRIDPGTPPKNVHSSSPFIIKLQMDMMARAHALIYDEERTFTVQILREKCSPLDWNGLDSAMMRHGIRDGLKMFAWAKRKSEWEFSIATDRVPEQTQPW